LLKDKQSPCRLIMNNTLIGKKIGMTQVFDDNNQQIPVTIIETGPCTVTQIKTVEKDGYNAVQIGFGTKKEKRSTKTELGHAKKSGGTVPQQVIEFRTEGTPEVKEGDVITVSALKDLQKVDVIGTTKGRGFQGVVKRYGFGGGPASHGSMFHRRGGSYGMCQWPGHVIKGKKMPGHMGNVQRTVQNLKIVKIIEEKNLVLIKGSFPGPIGGYVTVRPAKKTRK
jgi:large subunit ribosomal protein L3